MVITSWKLKNSRLILGARKLLQRQRHQDEAKKLDIDQVQQAGFNSRRRGIRTIPLNRIVGSVGRYQDFDSRFQFKHGATTDRFRQIKQAMRDGRPFPPVKLYQIKDEYYVFDGNHRISAAKELGHDEILADIVEFIPAGDDLDDVLYRERAEFYDHTQLPVEIRLTEIGQYCLLLEQIHNHQQYLQQSESSQITVKRAASDWYRTIYQPLCKIIKSSGLIEAFPNRTIADLYVYVSSQQWQIGRTCRYGMGIDELIPHDMEEFRRQMEVKKPSRYPEMKRTITVFILMNVQARKESRIIEKLIELDEVREVHSVHGDVDLLVKVNLTRDLLSSDAEIISQFVHDKVSKLSGVKSTKTLIPGISKIKK